MVLTTSVERKGKKLIIEPIILVFVFNSIENILIMK